MAEWPNLNESKLSVAVGRIFMRDAAGGVAPSNEAFNIQKTKGKLTKQ